MKKHVTFEASSHERFLIGKIVKRALKKRVKQDALDLLMDITAAHANGCSLDLSGLLKADEFDFWHDIDGIRRHMNRVTGQLDNQFVPRYALKTRFPHKRG